MVPPNLLALENYVKQFGHQVKVFDTSFYSDTIDWGNYRGNIESGSYLRTDGAKYGIKVKHKSSSEELLKTISLYKPDLIGFGVYSFTEKLADRLAIEIKKKFDSIPILYGGIDPSLNPIKTLSKKWVDFVCIGEGEKPLLEMCDAIENNRSLINIQNIWSKKNGNIIKNGLRPRINPNELALPNMDSYEKFQYYSPIEGNIYKLAMIEFGRGCPNSCSYCENRQIKKIYSEAKIHKFISHKTPRKFVDDCKYLIKKYGIEFFYIVDGTFLTMNDSVLEELSELYNKEVNKPFLCLTTIPSMSEKRIKLLKKMNCYQVNIGIETANQRYREEVLNRPKMTNEKIIKMFRLLHKYNIRSSAYNMIGLPWQNRKDVFETIELNRKCKPTRTNVNIYIPFPNITLTKRLIKEGYIDSNADLSDENFVTIDVPTEMNREEISGLYKTFNLYCKIPKLMFPLLKICEKDNKASRLIIKILRKIYLRG